MPAYSPAEVECLREHAELKCQVAAWNVIHNLLDREGWLRSDHAREAALDLRQDRILPVLIKFAEAGWFVVWSYSSGGDKGAHARINFAVTPQSYRPASGFGALYVIEPRSGKLVGPLAAESIEAKFKPCG